MVIWKRKYKYDEERNKENRKIGKYNVKEKKDNKLREENCK